MRKSLANRIALDMVKPDTNEDSLEAQTITCLVYVDKLEEGFRRWERGNYVAPGQERKKGARAQFETFVQACPDVPVYHPIVLLVGGDDFYVTCFIDGRHRFSVLRDSGADVIKVGLTRNSVRVAARFGILVELPEELRNIPRRKEHVAYLKAKGLLPKDKEIKPHE